MDFDAPKCVNGENTFFQRVSIEGFCVKSKSILENRGKNDFLSITRQKCILPHLLQEERASGYEIMLMQQIIYCLWCNAVM